MSEERRLQPLVLTRADLKLLGIPYCDSHLWRLIKREEFPAPRKLTPNGRNIWLSSEINAYIENLPTAAPKPQQQQRPVEQRDEAYFRDRERRERSKRIGHNKGPPLDPVDAPKTVRRRKRVLRGRRNDD
jgi:predicted DNA-binding transcriptional regulator AlpA